MVDKLNRYTDGRPRLRKIIGWSLVVVGFIALIAPILPGAPIVFVGLELLGLRFILTDKMKNFLRKEKAQILAPIPLPEKVN
jgi:uncharacterized protein YqgC (DUF456 family)